MIMNTLAVILICTGLISFTLMIIMCTVFCVMGFIKEMKKL